MATTWSYYRLFLHSFLTLKFSNVTVDLIIPPANFVCRGYTVSHFSYAPLFQGPHFFTKMLESNILYDNLFIDILSV